MIEKLGRVSAQQTNESGAEIGIKMLCLLDSQNLNLTVPVTTLVQAVLLVG